MPEECPPLFMVMGYLYAFIASFSGISYLLIWLAICESCANRPFAYPLIFVFLIFLIFAGNMLDKMLFPNRTVGKKVGKMKIIVLPLLGGFLLMGMGILYMLHIWLTTPGYLVSPTDMISLGMGFIGLTIAWPSFESEVLKIKKP